MADEGTPRRATVAGDETYLFRLWGRFSARRVSDGADLTPRGRKACALLACLLLEGRPVERERLASLLWSERGQTQAFASLRQCLLELRDLGPALRVDRRQVAVDPASCSTDLASLRAALDQGDASAVAEGLAGGNRLLDGSDGIDPAFDDWLRAARSAHGELLLEEARAGAGRALEAGDVGAAARLARRLLEIDPLDEAAARLAMEAAHRAGKHDALERIHAALAERLRADLGVEPSPETRALHRRLVARPDEGAARAGSSTAAAEADAPEEVRSRTAAPRPPARRWWTLLAASALLVAIIGAAFFWTTGRFGGRAEAASLAVLPFRNLSPGEDYFAEGVAEEILSQLAREPQLRVAGRTSSWMFDDPGVDLRDVGRRLDVRYVLEGSVRRAGPRVQVDVALVDTSDGMRLWSHAFRGTLDDMFAIQRTIGSEVVGRLRVQLVHAAPVTGPRTTRGEVYNLYLTARGLLRTREPANTRAAVGLLRTALRIDPNYAPAWAALGTGTILARQQMVMSPDGPTARAEQAAFEALMRQARRHVDRALALAPDLAEAHHARAMLDRWSPASLPYLERAVRLEPRNAEFWYGLYQVLATAEDYDGAFDAIRKVAEIDPFWIRAAGFSMAAWELGYPEEARRFDLRIARDHPEPVAREIARARIAFQRHDWSTAWAHLVRAQQMVPVSAQAFSDPPYFVVAIRAGHLEAIRRIGMPQIGMDMIEGRVPPLATIRTYWGSGPSLWEHRPPIIIISRVLQNSGRTADLIALYDEAFRSPDDFRRRHPLGDVGFLEDAPYLVVALRDVGRRKEAERMLAICGALAEARANARSFAMIENLARVWALQGRRERALAALERAVAMGWRYPQHGIMPRIIDEPYYRSLRDEPRLRRLDSIMQGELERERREARSITI